MALESGPSTQQLSPRPAQQGTTCYGPGSLSISHLPSQGPRAEAMMHSAMEQGNWVFFQNCHLAPSWMPSLERLIEGIDPSKVSCFTEQPAHSEDNRQEAGAQI